MEGNKEKKGERHEEGGGWKGNELGRKGRKKLDRNRDNEKANNDE